MLLVKVKRVELSSLIKKKAFDGTLVYCINFERAVSQIPFSIGSKTIYQTVDRELSSRAKILIGHTQRQGFPKARY